MTWGAEERKQWRLKNKERLREYDRQKYEKNKERYKAQIKAWQEANKDRCRFLHQRFWQRQTEQLGDYYVGELLRKQFGILPAESLPALIETKRQILQIQREAKQRASK